MFRFEDPTYLYWLAAIPVIVIIWLVIARKQKKNLKKFGDKQLVKELMPDVSKWRAPVKLLILLIALALLIIMAARPQMGIRTKTEKRVGIETIIAMDISNSMLAQDVSPSRLSRSKMLVENMIDKFTDDKVGLIVFAGESFVQLPITNDFVSAKMFLNTISPSMIETQGTDIRGAIDMAMHSFTQQEEVGRAIIIITDGEDHEGGAVEAAQEAKSQGMNVFVLGVGSVQGAPIPISGRNDYIKDNTGNVVMSALNEQMCKEIAMAGGGAYIHVTNNSGAQKLLDAELDKLAKSELSSTSFSELNEQFPVFAIIVILLLTIEVCILERSNPKFRNIKLFETKKKTTTVIALLLISTMAMAQSDRQYIRKGNSLFRKGAYAESEVQYQKALEKNKKNSQAAFNFANSQLMQRKDSAAIEAYQMAAKMETNPYRKAQSYHNIGVVCQTHQMYGDAIEAYKSALRLNPYDDTTRYNLALCKKLQKDEESDGGGGGEGEDQQQQDQQQQQQQDQQQDQQQQQPKENEMSKENAEQLLNAAVQREKDTQEKMEKQQQQNVKRRLEKNW